MAESIKLKKLNIFNVLFGYNNQLEDEENTALLSKEQIKKREEVDNMGKETTKPIVSSVSSSKEKGKEGLDEMISKINKMKDGSKAVQKRPVTIEKTKKSEKNNSRDDSLQI